MAASRPGTGHRRLNVTGKQHRRSVQVAVLFARMLKLAKPNTVVVMPCTCC